MFILKILFYVSVLKVFLYLSKDPFSWILKCVLDAGTSVFFFNMTIIYTYIYIVLKILIPVQLITYSKTVF